MPARIATDAARRNRIRASRYRQAPREHAEMTPGMRQANALPPTSTDRRDSVRREHEQLLRSRGRVTFALRPWPTVAGANGRRCIGEDGVPVRLDDVDGRADPVGRAIPTAWISWLAAS